MKINKKVLLSVVLIAIVLTAAGAATFAYFTAQRTTSANQFTVGTLDLDVASNNNKLEPFVVENLGTNANIGGTKTWTITNTGTLPGRLLFRVQNVVNKENVCNDQKLAVVPDCVVGDDKGRLGGVINLHIALDGTDVVSSTLATADQSKIGTDWMALAPIIVPAGGTKTITAYWAADENSYGNEIQGDSVSFDLNFRLIQQINGAAPAN